MNIVGEVENKDLILVDDMIDTAGTLTESVVALKNKGAKSIFACCTHPVLSGPAYKRIEESPIEKLITTNTIPMKQNSNKIILISVADLFARAIERIHTESSVSSLFI